MKFTVYSKNGCPYCDKVKQVLQLSKLEHVIYTLGEDFNREGFYHQFLRRCTIMFLQTKDFNYLMLTGLQYYPTLNKFLNR